MWLSFKSQYIQVEKSVVMAMSCEGLDKGEEFKMVPIVNNNNNVNVVSDSSSGSSEEDFENNKGYFFDKDVNKQVKISPQNTINAKVVWAIKKL